MLGDLKYMATEMKNLHELLTEKPLCVLRGVLEFGSAENDYCENFGTQWNEFRDVQIDTETGRDESAQRFWAETGWTPEDLKGKVLLDAGCGAGRFAEVALRAGARVVAVDLSEAAYACAETLSQYRSSDCLVLRASLFDLPLATQSFDGVYSLGVLQHTPDPLGAITVLARFVRPGGRLATWIYERRAISMLQSRTWLQAMTAGWSQPAKYRLSKLLTAVFFPAGWALSWLGRTGERVSHLLPYAARHHLARGDLRRQWRYSLMDTLDWYGPEYDMPQHERDVVATMQKAGLTGVRRLPARGMAIVGDRIEQAESFKNRGSF